VSYDPNIRGFKGGQIYTQANGVYWTPARRDLDTMLSKIDPGMMKDVVVLPGPYGVRYGPGLAFIDVIREPTPRYDCGFESHYDTTGNLRTNGGQLYGRETMSGGSNDWGFRLSYGERAGSDYRSGDGTQIPSSYHNRDEWGEFSFDINEHRRFDFAFQRLDQTDTEYPCQFFDINYLGTYGFESRLVDTDPLAPWTSLTLEGWYNHTNFRGTTPNPNPAFPVIDRVNYSLTLYYGTPSLLTGTTQGGVSSSGARTTATFGDLDDAHINVGADFRYLEQVIGETFNIWQGGTTPFDTFSTNMPHAWMRDPGMYVEWAKPVTDAWTTSIGARTDFVATRARASDVRPGTSLPGGDAFLTQDDTLYAFYCNNEYKLDEQWTLTAGFGHGQRPPTLIERYADGLFISSLQSGFTRMIGDPQLKEERDWQIDLGLSTEHEKWRGKANVFQSWIVDYVTYMGSSVFQPEFLDARLLYFMNTPMATLTGFELYGEYDLLPRMSTFGRMSYVDGRDQTLDAPLPAISPLDSSVGFRFHDVDKGKVWGIDLAARIVADQNRLGTIRTITGETVVEEPTPGFTTFYVHGYWNYTKNLRLIAGIDNLLDRNYQEHLDLRLSGPTGYSTISPTTRVLAPGFSPFFGVNWVF
jgi:outer membrane receptor protein involved in Fe transport